MSDFNKILAFQPIMNYATKEEQEKIAEILNMDIKEINRRLVGKDKEDEFVLILLFMDICTNIAGFDEGISQLSKTATSDLIITLKNDEQFMLEIKHTDKDKYLISGGNLKKRIEYAKQMGFELYFAISIKGIWMLFTSQYLQEKNGKIDISDLIKSKLDEKLKCISYIFPKGLAIKSVYSKEEKKSLGIGFPPYGYLKSYELYYNNNKIFRIKGKNSPIFLYMLILEGLQDRLSMDKQSIEMLGENTIIIESFTEDFNIISEYRFLLAPIEHTINDIGEKYTMHNYIESAKVDSEILKFSLKLGIIRGLMQILVDKGVDIKYAKENEIFNLPKSK